LTVIERAESVIVCGEKCERRTEEIQKGEGDRFATKKTDELVDGTHAEQRNADITTTVVNGSNSSEADERR